MNRVRSERKKKEIQSLGHENNKGPRPLGGGGAPPCIR